MHVSVYIYRKRELFPFFFFSIGRRSADPRAPCRPGHRQSPLSFPQPRYIRSSTRARFSGRGKFRPTSSSQPLYSTVLQLVFERNSAADRGRHKVFSVRHLEWYRESFVNGGGSISCESSVMIGGEWCEKSVSLFFTFHVSEDLWLYVVLECWEMICEKMKMELFLPS